MVNYVKILFRHCPLSQKKNVTLLKVPIPNFIWKECALNM